MGGSFPVFVAPLKPGDVSQPHQNSAMQRSDRSWHSAPQRCRACGGDHRRLPWGYATKGWSNSIILWGCQLQLVGYPPKTVIIWYLNGTPQIKQPFGVYYGLKIQEWYYMKSCEIIKFRLTSLTHTSVDCNCHSSCSYYINPSRHSRSSWNPTLHIIM